MHSIDGEMCSRCRSLQVSPQPRIHGVHIFPLTRTRPSGSWHRIEPRSLRQTSPQGPFDTCCTQCKQLSRSRQSVTDTAQQSQQSQYQASRAMQPQGFSQAGMRGLVVDNTGPRLRNGSPENRDTYRQMSGRTSRQLTCHPPPPPV